MRLALVFGAAIVSVSLLGQAQTAQEWKLDLRQYGLVKAHCVWYPGHLEFLDDDHLVVSAPVSYTCDKGDRDKPTDTNITVIDLQGHKVAATRRSDVVELNAGPIGYFSVCTGDRVELLSRDLQVARSISLWSSGKSGGCYFGVGLSPSQMAMVIPSPANSALGLYHGTSSYPIAEISTSKGQIVTAVADDGFLVCSKDERECEVVGSPGAEHSFVMPKLGISSGYYIVGFISPDRLLVANFSAQRLYAATPSGDAVIVGDISKIKPPFINSSDTKLSASEPRRILYRVDGCLLGDWDDCYGVVFRRFAVFDSQTSKILFRHSYAPGANLKISPNGHIVMEQDGAEVHLFRIP
ncbi:MAG TPA: hypothetical protein VE291_07540 [Terracidiphilus sp.]|jgi:hypothetical protein|nr:hypothetical protein [Terracidiphilus sp.]